MIRNFKRCTFENDWYPRYSSIFVTHPSELARFVRDDWCELLFPERIMFRPEVDHIVEALLRVTDKEKDSEIMVTSPEVEPQFQDAFLANAEASALADVFEEPSICHFDHVAFSYSASWGIFSAVDLDYSAIAGEAILMQNLLQHLGGLELVKSSFVDYWQNQQSVDDRKKKQLLTSVGW